MRTKTKFFRFAKLATSDGASIVVRLAMVCNDLAIANASMGRFKEVKSNALNHIRRGALMYFVRMSCGHLREGITAIQALRDHPVLILRVKKCRPDAQSAFVDLCQCLPGGRDHADFQRYVKPIRDKIGFHYDGPEVGWALEDRAKRSIPFSITMGEDIHSSRFDFADDILDTIVCLKLWRIPLDKDVRAAADLISDWCFQKSMQFFSFGGDFVTRFLMECAA
jgi:hypothetical protein